MKKYLTIGILFFNIYLCYGQECVSNFNFNEFSPKGYTDSYWQVDDSINVYNSQYFFNPTFFVSSEILINVLVKGTILVESNNDNDFVGIVFGYKDPNRLGTDLDYDFYLFDWKRENEFFKNYMGYEGFRLSKYNGFITEGDLGQYFWGGDNLPPKRLLYGAKKGEGLGWKPFQKYNFELLYTVNLIRIKIDGEIIFERQGCYEVGKFGLYSMSQDRARFEDFTYEFKAEAGIYPKQACVGEPVYFESFNPLCSSVPSNIESINWDFGDGQISNLPNPYHEYSYADDLNVELLIKTSDGCVDTAIATVTINPIPIVNLGNDTTLPFLDSITLDAGNIGSDYTWSNQSNHQTVHLSQLTTDTTVWVTVNSKSCLGSDTIQIIVEAPPRHELSFPKAFTPNGDGINDVFGPIGIEQLLIDYQMLIFNRWGQLIFESNDFYAGWDGLYNGKHVAMGVYVFKVNYSVGYPDMGIEKLTANGSLTLLK